MQKSQERTPILIQGANGHLGCYIVKQALLDSRLQVNVMTRDTSKNQDLWKKVESAGGRVFKADLSDKSSVKDITKGMHIVICTVSGNCEESTCVEGQKALIDDCVKNGVKLFVPSIFGMDNDRFSREELLACPMTAFKVKIDDYLKSSKLPSLRIYVGIMMEQLFDLLRETHCYWGDEKIKHDLTTFENAARLTVEAVARMDMTGGKIRYSGGRYTMKEIQDTYNKVRGTKMELKRAGSLDDLKKMIESKKSQGDEKSLASWRLQSLIYDERSSFVSTDNKSFTEVKPTSLEEFLNEHSEIMI